MNRYPKRHNVLGGAVSTLLLAGAIACSPSGVDADPTSPPTGAAPAPGQSPPSCEVVVDEVNGRTATFSLKAEDHISDGEYYPASVTWLLGDGTPASEGPFSGHEHTYDGPGTFKVGANMIMEPFSHPDWGKGSIACDGAVVRIN